MASNKEQIVPKSEPLEESFQSFASTVDQLDPNEELYDIKQEFRGDFENEIEDSTCQRDEEFDESTVYNSTRESMTPGEQDYDIKQEFEGTCYATSAVKNEPWSEESTLDESSCIYETESKADNSASEAFFEPETLPAATSSPIKSSTVQSFLPSPPSSPSKLELPIPSIPVLLAPSQRRNEESQSPGTEKYTELLRRRVELKLFEKLDSNLLSALPISPRTRKDIKTLQSKLRYCHRLQIYSDINKVEEKYMEELTDSQVKQYRKRKAQQLEKIKTKRRKVNFC